MYKGLQFKIILIFVIFTIVLMSAIGIVMVSSSFSYYNSSFSTAMNEAFEKNGNLMIALNDAIDNEDYVSRIKEVLRAYSSSLGIDASRNFFILSITGEYLDGSDATLGTNMIITPNIVTAMLGENGTQQKIQSGYSDYAVYLESGENQCIVYVKDTNDDAKDFTSMIFRILAQTLLAGMVVAIILSYFLSKAISTPIRELTNVAQKISLGNYDESVEINATDEIGTLSDTINNMKDVIRNKIDEVTSERKNFESLFVYLNDPVIVFDRYGGMININRQARKLFHMSKEEVKEMQDRFTLPKMIRLSGLSPEFVTKQLLETKDTVFHDVVIYNKICDMKFTEFSYTKDKSNKGVMCVIHDNTERLALEKSRKEFVSDVSHELRTPLTAIKGFVETVALHPELDEEIKNQFMNDVIFECDRMTRIVEDLLVLSRLDNNRTSWKVETFDFKMFMEHLYNIMTVEANKHSHTLTCKVETGLEPMTGDKEKLQQVLVNVISNSIKYTADGGKIAITASKAENGVLVTVEDNGMGIPQEDIPRLFERFYRVEKARTTDSGGSGLGLAITKEILESHGGTIWVESELDKGTKMSIFMPYVSKVALDNTTSTQLKN